MSLKLASSPLHTLRIWMGGGVASRVMHTLPRVQSVGADSLALHPYHTFRLWPGLVVLNAHLHSCSEIWCCHGEPGLSKDRHWASKCMRDANRGATRLWLTLAPQHLMGPVRFQLADKLRQVHNQVALEACRSGAPVRVSLSGPSLSLGV